MLWTSKVFPSLHLSSSSHSHRSGRSNSSRAILSSPRQTDDVCSSLLASLVTLRSLERKISMLDPATLESIRGKAHTLK
jgi:hypothetical protein